MKQKQVLFIGMSPNMGGIETFMMNVFMKLEGHGFHFTFINTSRKKLAYQNKILNNGGTIKHVIINPSFIGHLFRYEKAYKFFQSHHNYDIVHLNAVTINVLFWLKAAERFNIPKLIIHSHNDGIIYSSIIKKMLAKFLNWQNIKYLRSHPSIEELAVSNNSGKWMFHNNHFKVVKNGIDTNKFKFRLKNRIDVRKHLDININDKVIISVARLEPQKNCFRIIKIFSIINHIYPSSKLIMAGDGSEKESLIKYIDKLHISNNVILLGPVNNVNEILSGADLMLMPSKYEGFPFSLLECQSVGVPALVSSEAVPLSANVTGNVIYLSLGKSNNMWANTVCDLLNKKNSYENKSKMNNKVYKSPYNVDRSVANIRYIYESRVIF